VYPRPGYPLVPAALRAIVTERVPRWLLQSNPNCPDYLADLGSDVWEELDRRSIVTLASMVLASCAKQVELLDSICIPQVSERRLEKLDLILEHRTRRLLRLEIALGSYPRTAGDLLRIRNFGVRSLLDFLVALGDEAAAPASGEFGEGGADERLGSRAQNGSRKSASFAARESRPNALIALPSEWLGLAPATAFLLLLASFSQVDRIILNDRIVSASPQTLQEVANRVGLTRERVRQRESRIIRLVRQMVKSPANYQVFRNLNAVASSFDQDVCESRALSESMLRAFPTPAGSVLPESALPVLRFLLGFTEFDDGFWFKSSPAPLWRAASSELSKGIVAGSEEAFLLLLAERMNLPMTFLAAARRKLNLRIVAGILLPWNGSLADKAERVFIEAGTPLTFEEICNRMELRDASRPSLKNYVLGDGRFMRISRARFALTEWGYRRYAGIRDAIQRSIEDAGGMVALDSLLSVLPTKFDVAESSVRNYAAGPGFKIDNFGFVSESSGQSEVSTIDAAPWTCRHLFRHSRVWYLRIRVGEDHLRGSGRVIPVAAAAQLALSRGSETKRVVDDIEIRFSWAKSMQPVVGSIRDLAVQKRARLGDMLFVGLSEFDEQATAFITQPAAEFENLTRLALLAGVRGFGSDLGNVRHIATSIGLESNTSSIDILRLRFAQRHDDEALDLLDGLAGAPFERSANQHDLASMLEG
jgi:hypothetical protein